MTTKEKRFNHSIDTSNYLKRSIDLLHIQDVVIDDMVAYANDEHNRRMELLLDDMMSLNHVIIKEINQQSSDILDRSIARLNRS